MNTLEKRHLRLSANLTTLGSISSAHPFTQQVDVVFPSRYDELENALSALKTRYAKGKVDLAKVFGAGPDFVHPYGPLSMEHRTSSAKQTQYASDILALSSSHIHDAQDDDVWCIDTRGVLTLCVCKETYERLGLVGQKLSFKHQSGERYVISLPLHENAKSVAVQVRRRSALESWDASFTLNVAAPGTKSPDPSITRPVKGMWEVIYCSTGPNDDNSGDSLDRWSTQVQIVNPAIHNVTCEISHLENVWIPDPASLPPRPQPEQEEDQEDWDHEVSTLFEWIGMAGLHAQRLQANDRVDPFVAMYEPPTTSRVGNVTHFRWRGLLSPSFVQAVVDTSVTLLKSSQTPTKTFVAITAHGITNSPVVYLPQPRTETSKGKLTAAAPSPPSHLPRKDGEDAWCLVLAPPKEGHNDVKSILYESVGQWDTRWG